MSLLLFEGYHLGAFADISKNVFETVGKNIDAFEKYHITIVIDVQ